MSNKNLDKELVAELEDVIRAINSFCTRPNRRDADELSAIQSCMDYIRITTDKFLVETGYIDEVNEDCLPRRNNGND